MKIFIFLKRLIICTFLLCFLSPINAQQTPDKVVKDFGEALSSWCKTNEIIYRERIEELCSGSRKCRVEDKIYADYRKLHGLTNYETFVLDSYLNMFESMIINKSLKCEMSNVRVNKSLDEAQIKYYVTANMKYSGAINKESCYVFVVRDEKICAIYSSSSSRGESILDKIQDN